MNLSEAFPETLQQYDNSIGASFCPSTDMTISNIVIQLENVLTEDEYDEGLVESVLFFFQKTPNIDKVIKGSVSLSLPMSTHIRSPVSQDNNDVMSSFETMMRNRNMEVEAQLRPELIPKKKLLEHGQVLKALEFFKNLEELDNLSVILRKSKALSKTLRDTINESDDVCEKFEKIKESLEQVKNNIKLMSQLSPESKEMTKFLKFDILDEMVKKNLNKSKFTDELNKIITLKCSQISESVNSNELECTICLEEKPLREYVVNTNCGHMVCTECSNALTRCHMCRSNKSYIKLYPN